MGVEPDLIRVAKSIAMGLPLSGVLGKAAIMDAPQTGGVGGTYVGNPVAQAAALAVLDVIEDEGLVERSDAIGETIRARTLALEGALAGDPRSSRPRIMLAIELAVDGARKPSKDVVPRSPRPPSIVGFFCSRPGVYGTPSAPSCPLVVGDPELDEALEGLGAGPRDRAIL